MTIVHIVAIIVVIIYICMGFFTAMKMWKSEEKTAPKASRVTLFPILIFMWPFWYIATEDD